MWPLDCNRTLEGKRWLRRMPVLKPARLSALLLNSKVAEPEPCHVLQHRLAAIGESLTPHQAIWDEGPAEYVASLIEEVAQAPYFCRLIRIPIDPFNRRCSELTVGPFKRHERKATNVVHIPSQMIKRDETRSPIGAGFARTLPHPHPSRERGDRRRADENHERSGHQQLDEGKPPHQIWCGGKCEVPLLAFHGSPLTTRCNMLICDS